MAMSNRIMRRRQGLSKGVYIFPNLCTTASLFCGFFSVVKSLSAQPIAAAWAILLAGVFDLLDGRVARLTHSESEFGIEYDSLVDLASFGLAPGILIYTWSLYGLGKIGWLAAFLYFACGAMRLARYNLQHNTIETKKFQGLPIPVAAYVLATYVIFYHNFFMTPIIGSVFVLLMTVALALLMVSSIAYPSFKQLDFKRKRSFFVLVLFVFGLFFVALKPEETMFVLVVAYVLYGVFYEAFMLYKKMGSKTSLSDQNKEARDNHTIVDDGGETIADIAPAKQNDRL
ncbi:MAG: CDP-diacylglycerol--serine O-phosphatidyltransferase [Deltaproteobacteria bacterium CG07_land_8_20_14_0_80_38_7]|nr:MAG: CDP-diacylglycerol--serine O-phosphatidyltransferase [Deltaproteobacteria bacterium CG07_land_8_20_14_0_80_38_7]